MNTYIPVPNEPKEYLYAPCPWLDCEITVRSGREGYLTKLMNRHLRKHHNGQKPPEPEKPKIKKIDITAVYYSGNMKRMRAQVPPFDAALVSGHFPGTRGCAVVQQSSDIKIYPCLGAGVKGWEKMK